MLRLVKFVLQDILKNRIILGYTIFLAVLTWAIFALEDNTSKGILTILNTILLVIPLVSIIFSTIYLYNSGEFIELLISQPVQRSKIWVSFFVGLAIALCSAFLVGVALPMLIFEPTILGLMMILIGVFITTIFVALACLSAVLTRDKAKGIGVSMLLWLFFALLFDGIILFLLYQFAEYPIEKMMVGVTAFSPIDLARIMILLHLDVSAMMGYTGAIFKHFFGNMAGLLVSFMLMLLWIIVPFMVSLNRFKKMDL